MAEACIGFVAALNNVLFRPDIETALLCGVDKEDGANKTFGERCDTFLVFDARHAVSMFGAYNCIVGSNCSIGKNACLAFRIQGFNGIQQSAGCNSSLTDMECAGDGNGPELKCV